MHTHDTTDHEQNLLDHWQEATTTDDGAPAPGPRYRLDDEPADAPFATGEQRQVLTMLLNSHRITRRERTRMLLAINQLSLGYALRAIARLRRAVTLRLDGPGGGPHPSGPAAAGRGGDGSTSYRAAA